MTASGLPLSVLDLSPVWRGVPAADSIRDSIALAQAAEALGYRRFWVAEHHAMRSFGGSAPEILLGALTQATRRIRLGSGGVMLSNYSPLKVAEQFMALEALAPGRIDLGVGRALGADPRTAAALRSAGEAAFGRHFALLNAWLLDAAGKEAFPPEHPAHGVRAQPFGPSHPDLHLLCTSEESARFAGLVGVGMVFAEFISRKSGADAIAAYRNAFSPSPFRSEPWSAIAVSALAAETPEAARRLDGPRRKWAVGFAEGRHDPFDPGAEPPVGDGAPDDPLVGDGASVRAQLAARIEATGADEVFVLTLAQSLDDRIRSLALAAGEA